MTTVSESARQAFKLTTTGFTNLKRGVINLTKGDAEGVADFLEGVLNFTGGALHAGDAIKGGANKVFQIVRSDGQHIPLEGDYEEVDLPLNGVDKIPEARPTPDGPPNVDRTAIAAAIAEADVEFIGDDVEVEHVSDDDENFDDVPDLDSLPSGYYAEKSIAEPQTVQLSA